MKRAFLLAVLAAFPTSLAAQDGKKQGAAGVDPKRVDEAIRKGVEYLRRADSPAEEGIRIQNSDELILWTLIHAGVSASDPVYQKYFKGVMEGKLERTYKVVLKAMILEELDRVKYQLQICECAQFLVDNQCANGQWTYGEPTQFVPPVKDTATGGEKSDVSTSGKPGAGGRPPKPDVKRKLQVKKTRSGPGVGDNSNSQYAALGLRACFDAGIRFPAETVPLAKKWWVDSQQGAKDQEKDNAVSTGNSYGGPARGWCYDSGHNPYASMTAGAVGAVVIYDFILGTEWKGDPTVRSGLGWMGKYFKVTENYGLTAEWGGVTPRTYHYYYLYALERVGLLYGTERIGNHNWYPEGANFLLNAQHADGSWSAGGGAENRVTWDTCFAILFLKRATRALVDVASEDKRASPKKE